MYLQRTTVPYPASPDESLGTFTDRNHHVRSAQVQCMYVK